MYTDVYTGFAQIFNNVKVLRLKDGKYRPHWSGLRAKPLTPLQSNRPDMILAMFFVGPV